MSMTKTKPQFSGNEQVFTIRGFFGAESLDAAILKERQKAAQAPPPPEQRAQPPVLPADSIFGPRK